LPFFGWRFAAPALPYELHGEIPKPKAEEGKKMEMQGRSLARSALWIITCYEHNRVEVHTIEPEDGGGSSLAVFNFKEAVERFLGSLKDDQRKHDWQSRETSAGELLSILYGPCKGVRWVALDPLPSLLGRAMSPFVRVNRKRFVRSLMGEREDFAKALALG